MADLFAKIPAQFTRALILSAFFPVLLFFTAFTLVVLPMTNRGADFVSAVRDPAVWSQSPFVVLIVTIIILVLSIVLNSMNVPIIRFYEGYPWRKSFIAAPFLARQLRIFDRATQTRHRINALGSLIRNDPQDLTKYRRIAGEAQGEIVRLLNAGYPDKRQSVLPTRLGNVIRAFETYTTRFYGVPIIVLWPRLNAVIDSTMSQSIDSAKTSFDFMLHSAFLSGILAVSTAIGGLYWATPTPMDLWQPWLGWTLFFAFTSFLFYKASIPRAIEWGSQVKVAFDLNRSALLKKLGYDLEPSSLAEEREIWKVINYQFAFPDERNYPDLPYKKRSTYLYVKPALAVVKTRRLMQWDGSHVQVTLTITNADPLKRKVTSLIVEEHLPTGYRYELGSAELSGAPAMVRSVDPLQVSVGPIAPERAIKLSFRLKAPK